MFYIKDAMGNLVKMGSRRKTAQEKADKLYGPGKYKVINTHPEYDKDSAIMGMR